VNTVSDKVIKHSLAYLFVQKMVREGRPLQRENLAETDQPLQGSRFPINIRSSRTSRHT